MSYTLASLKADTLTELGAGYEYPDATLTELANSGLRALGDIPLVAEVAIPKVTTSSYSATIEWSKRRPLRIDYLAIQGESVADPWRTVHDWDFVPAAPGSSSLILFKDALPVARPMRIWYQTAHPILHDDADQVAGAVSPELAVAACVERALRWQNARLGGSDEHLAARWQEAQHVLAATRRGYPIWKPRRSTRLLRST